MAFHWLSPTLVSILAKELFDQLGSTRLLESDNPGVRDAQNRRLPVIGKCILKTDFEMGKACK